MCVIILCMKLLCPICEKPLERINRSAVCENKHSFDYAKQGYLNLLIKQSVDHGDNKEMVVARSAFLNSGNYQFLRDRLVEIIGERNSQDFVDLGCGEGYYTQCIPSANKVGIDMSKDALKHAARMDKSTQYIVASIFHLPLETESCDSALTCFAPFAKDEIERVLKQNGIFVFVSPGPKHLTQLKQLLYDVPYDNEVKPLETDLKLIQEETIQHTFCCNQEVLMNLFKMTPYYHRTKAVDIARLEQIDQLDVTAEFVIRVYQKMSA